jgi:hypothetical protein
MTETTASPAVHAGDKQAAIFPHLAMHQSQQSNVANQHCNKHHVERFAAIFKVQCVVQCVVQWILSVVCVVQ